MKYASIKDLKAIAKCHVKAFPDSVTSMLGDKVVASMFEWYLSDSNKFLFFIEENGEVIGYCGGHIIDGTDNWGSSSGMTQFGMSSAYLAFLRKPWLLFHPEITKRYKFILTNIKRRLFSIKAKETTINKQPSITKSSVLKAGLVVIGVKPELQGKGIGSILQKEFERKAREMGANQLELSVRVNNKKAIRSYELNGYNIEKTDSVSHIMIKNLL